MICLMEELSVWADTIKRIKEINPGITMESLIPDFDANSENIQKIIDAVLKLFHIILRQ
jgi:lipoate synthase